MQDGAAKMVEVVIGEMRATLFGAAIKAVFPFTTEQNSVTRPDNDVRLPFLRRVLCHELTKYCGF